jgi:ribosomal protein S18 acetylase RimI-like enzyme
MNITVQHPQSEVPHTFDAESIAQFLETHLDQYGDEKADIMKCLDYVEKRGGVVLIAHEEEIIKGAVIINDTGMSGYIPEHILVYIAVDRSTRGQGVGQMLMKKAFEETSGNIALHVEPDNPAKKLYEKLGFTNKYLEMRWNRTIKPS